jgi:NAD(P)-dependent dehydrogenase (short-subunit alcohol dehydrogenase family)
MTGKVAIVTGASRGIGAGLAAGYRRQGWAVVTSARTITPSADPGVLTVTGDIADAEIADRIIGGAYVYASPRLDWTSSLAADGAAADPAVVEVVRV